MHTSVHHDINASAGSELATSIRTLKDFFKGILSHDSPDESGDSLGQGKPMPIEHVL